MEMIDVESSQIESVGFSNQFGLMDVRFKTGSIYRYENVTEELFNSFKQADSIGKFFGATFKNDVETFPFKKIRASNKEIEKFQHEIITCSYCRNPNMEKDIVKKEIYQNGDKTTRSFCSDHCSCWAQMAAEG